MRGKEAAQAAKRRAEALEQRVNELEVELRERASDHVVEIQSLRTECARLRGQLTRGVDQASRDAISAAQRSAEERVAEVELSRDEAVLSAVGMLYPIIARAHLDIDELSWRELSKSTGVNLRKLQIAGGETVIANRRARRDGAKPGAMGVEIDSWRSGERERRQHEGQGSTAVS